MSEQQAPDRTIRGFGAARGGGGVHPDASRLLARNRVAPPAAPTPALTGAPAAVTVSPGLAATVPSVSPRAAPSEEAAQRAGSATVAAVKCQVNVMVATDLRARIRSAYRATSTAEGHRSFSDFVAHLLEAEAERLEARYNDGRRFGGGQQPLAPGRPLDP